MHKSAACSHVQITSAYISAQKIGKIRSTFLIKIKSMNFLFYGMSDSEPCIYWAGLGSVIGLLFQIL